MGFEIPLDSDYDNHPKTLQLISLIGPEADVYPLRLWMWASKYAREGVVRGGWRQVERACRWSGKPHRLSRALVAAGFVERDEQTIHNWNRGIGRAIALYERKKQKQREKYARRKGILPEDRGQNSPNPENPSNPEYSGEERRERTAPERQSDPPPDSTAPIRTPGGKPPGPPPSENESEAQEVTSKTPPQDKRKGPLLATKPGGPCRASDHGDSARLIENSESENLGSSSGFLDDAKRVFEPGADAGPDPQPTDDGADPPTQPARDPVVHHLLGVARRVTKMPNRVDTLVTHLTAAKERYGAPKVEQWLMDPENIGSSVILMADSLERQRKAAERIF